MCITTEARAPVLLVVALGTIGVITESPDIETHLLARSVMTVIAKFSADRAGDAEDEQSGPGYCAAGTVRSE